MSRLGKIPIDMPVGVTVSVANHRIHVTGPKGKLEKDLPVQIEVKADEVKHKVVVSCDYKAPNDSAVHGLIRSLINGMIIGVTKGYEKKIDILGVGYNAKIQGNELTLQIGYSHPLKIKVPVIITLTVPNPNQLIMQSVDKESLGRFAAEIRDIKPCNPYTLKGIKYAGEVIKKKAGKTFASTAG